MPTHRVVIMPGDGIGPEVMDAARDVLDASGASLEWEVHEVGKRARDAGSPELVPEASRAAILDCGVALKGPLAGVTTDPGSGSANVALRRALDLFVQIRRIRSLRRVVRVASDFDLVVARVMTEDLNAGIEYQAGSSRARELAAWVHDDGHEIDRESAFSLKIMSWSAVERAADFAYRWAERHGRHGVTVAHKATIMRATDALFVDTTRAVAATHPSLDFDDMLIDDLVARLVRDPSAFDVVLTSNLYGDIVSSLAAGLAGSIGVVAGASYGTDVAVFEAAHGSAPKYAGRDLANPCGAILAGALMLRHLGERDAATRVERAVEEVVREGQAVTADLATPGSIAVGTRSMTAVIAQRVASRRR
jgi:isocitrate dehydrogenase (NAD+)